MSTQTTVEQWRNGTSVKLQVTTLEEMGDLFMWLLENVGVRGNGWEFGAAPAWNSVIEEFIFLDSKKAMLFQLKWSHLCQ